MGGDCKDREIAKTVYNTLAAIDDGICMRASWDDLDVDTQHQLVALVEIESHRVMPRLDIIGLRWNTRYGWEMTKLFLPLVDACRLAERTREQLLAKDLEKLGVKR